MWWWNVLQLKLGTPKTRLQALFDLTEKPDARALNAVANVGKDALRTGVHVIAETAAEALGAMRNSQAIPSLVYLLEKGPVKVQIAAIEALGEIGDPEAVPAIVSALGTSAEVRQAGITALAQFGVPAIETLMKTLYHQNEKLSGAVAEALAQIGSLAVPLLIIRLKHDKADLPKSEFATFVSDKEKADIRKKVAAILVKIGMFAVPALVEVLDHEDQDVRLHAAEVLGKVGDTKAKTALVGLLQDDNEAVRKVAVKSLEKLKWRPTNIEERALWAVVFRNWEEAAACGEASVKPLVADLADPDLSIRENVSKTLIRIGKHAVVPMIQFLDDTDPTTRFNSARILGELGDERAVNALVKHLDDPDPSVRDNLVLSLWKLGGPGSVAGLIEALEDEDHTIRSRAALALGEMREPLAIEPLLAAAEDDEMIKVVAAMALLKIAPARAVGPLTRLAVEAATAAEAIVALSEVFKDVAAEISPEDLRALVNLEKSEEETDQQEVRIRRPAIVKRSADPMMLAMLARDELRRRGLKE